MGTPRLPAHPAASPVCLEVPQMSALTQAFNEATLAGAGYAIILGTIASVSVFASDPERRRDARATLEILLKPRRAERGSINVRLEPTTTHSLAKPKAELPDATTTAEAPDTTETTTR